MVLTVFYSFVLVRMGMSSKRFFMAGTEYSSLVPVQRLPLFFLLTLRISQGWVFDLAQITSAPVLHSLISWYTLGNILTGLLLAIVIVVFFYEETPAFICLSHCTRFLSVSARASRSLNCTEVSLVHGGGLGTTLSAFTGMSRPYLWLLKSTVWLGLIYLLV